MKNAIEINNLSKLYRSKLVFDNLSVAFPEGKVSGLLGPNGAGKSTLFKLLVGNARANSGKIEVFGQTPGWQFNADIAFLSDRARWYQFQTIKEAMEYASVIFPHFDQKRGLELLYSMKLEPAKRIRELSKGEEARLLLTLCLARDVKLLLLDEPFSGIDLLSREHIIHSIIDLMSEKRITIIISTHEIHEAESLFDYVVFLNEGKICLAQDVESLRTQSQSIEAVYRRLFQ